MRQMASEQDYIRGIPLVKGGRYLSQRERVGVRGKAVSLGVCGIMRLIHRKGQRAQMVESQMSLETRIGDHLVSKHLTLAVAESCTGGLVCHRITNVPGSSRYLEGGVVAYSYSAKERLLEVDHDTLYEHGAVSEETAREMADKARRIFGTDIGVAVTGIAGPSGGLPGKPVGLIYIALSARGTSRCVRYVWSHDRAGNKAASAEATLQLLLDYLEGLCK